MLSSIVNWSKAFGRWIQRTGPLVTSKPDPFPVIGIYELYNNMTSHIELVPCTIILHEGTTHCVAQMVLGRSDQDPYESVINAPSYADSQRLLNARFRRPIRLTWESLIPVPFEFTVEGTHDHFRLYQDALHYLKSISGPSEPALLHATAEASQKQLYQHHPSLSTLVNVLADRYCLPYPCPVQVNVSIFPDSTLDFLLFGMLYLFSMSRKEIVGEDGYSFLAQSNLKDGLHQSDGVYQAALLDILTYFWMRECENRFFATWSPMPWSRFSIKECAEDVSVLPTPMMEPHTPNARQLDAVADDDIVFRLLRSTHGDPVDIPWLGAPHDGYPLCPTLYSYTRVRRANLTPSLRDDAALLLAAVTFGLLEAITGMKIPERQLLRTSKHDRSTVISGRAIVRIMYLWQSSMRYDRWSDPHARAQRGREVARLLDQALFAINEEYKPGDGFRLLVRAGFSEEVRSELAGFVVLTIFSLCSQAASLWPEVPAFQQRVSRSPDGIHHAIAENAVRENMIKEYWCPYIVSPGPISAVERRHLSSLLRLPPFIRNVQDEHRNCTTDACTFYTITDTDNYVPRHTKSSCQCEYIQPPFPDIERILSKGERGTIPVVVWDGQKLSVQSGVDVPYVAISHVWADGLGSTTEKGLPLCQVVLLANLAKRLLPGAGAIWMDSLCVPERRDLRKRAIKLMAETYKEAAVVLVLDACVRSQCSLTKPWTENFLRIGTSGWVRRVWTLQEGILARKLFFEFSDGLVDIEDRFLGDEVATFSKSPSPVFRNLLQWAGSFPLLVYRAHQRGTAGVQYSLDNVIELLRFRTTTKAEDETVAIASLLPVDVGELLAFTGPDAAALRMRSFLLQLGKVPRRFPFADGRKMDLPNFRWAPCALAEVMSGNSGQYGTATCTEEGLFAEYDILSLDAPVDVPASLLDSAVDGYMIVFVAATPSEHVYVAAIQLSHLRASRFKSKNASMQGRAASFDTLLFISEGSLDTGVLPVAAVLRRPGTVSGSGSAKGGATEGITDYLHCEHVSTGTFSRLPSNPKEFEVMKQKDSIIVGGRFWNATVHLT